MIMNAKGGMKSDSRILHDFYDPNNNSTVETAFVSDFHIVDMIGIFLLIPLIYIVMRMVEFCFGLPFCKRLYWHSCWQDLFISVIKKEYIDIFYAFCCWFLQYFRFIRFMELRGGRILLFPWYYLYLQYTYSMYFPINRKIYPRFSLRVMVYSAY